MKNMRKLALLLTMFSFSFCNSEHISSTTSAVKIINGKKYEFSNQLIFEKSEYWNLIKFYGVIENTPIILRVSKPEIESKLAIKETDNIDIDSITFNMNDKNDNIDLIYYLNANNSNRIIEFTLIEENDRVWKIR